MSRFAARGKESHLEQTPRPPPASQAHSEEAMNENDCALPALADEPNTAHAALSDLDVPVVLEGEPLSLTERIAWLNLARPAAEGDR